MVHAGVSGSSYLDASRSLAALADLNVGPKPIERLVAKIGRERIAARDAAAATHQALPLMERDAVADPDRPRPPVAMVSVDGGRLQVRSPSSPAGGRWRESKTAVLETYRSEVRESDPDPDVPRCFLDLKRSLDIVRGLGHATPPGLEFEEKSEPKPSGRSRSKRPGRPDRLVRSVLASRAGSGDFGELMHQAAWERNFFGSDRRVFLGDGQAANWTIHRQHFSTFTPVLDFVHALSYVFAAAFAGRSKEEGAATYVRWIQTVWSGGAAKLAPELEARSTELGPPPEDCSEADPRRLVAETLRYLKNNADRMRYDECRRQGLPMMTSAVESTIKMINRRVKGSEKFWSETGAEAILQLRADQLSETEVMEQFWAARETQMDGRRPYRRSA